MHRIRKALKTACTLHGLVVSRRSSEFLAAAAAETAAAAAAAAAATAPQKKNPTVQILRALDRDC